MAGNFYVYLLVEEVSEGVEEVFYIGKGRGTRGSAHLLEYVRSAAAGADTAPLLRLAGADEAEQRTETSIAAAAIEQEEHAKIARIRQAHRGGRGIRVDLLRTDLTEEAAYAIESAVIDAFGLDRLTNVVHGHSHGRIPALAAMRVLDAELVAVDAPGFQVVVSGVWGGGNSLSGLLAADADAVWENARQSWAIASAVRREIDEAGNTETPLVLVAVAKGPSATYGGIILGIWEIARVTQATDRIDRRGQVTEGWAYVAAPISPRVEMFRRQWLLRRSASARQVGPTRIGVSGGP